MPTQRRLHTRNGAQGALRRWSVERVCAEVVAMPRQNVYQYAIVIGRTHRAKLINPRPNNFEGRDGRVALWFIGSADENRRMKRFSSGHQHQSKKISDVRTQLRKSLCSVMRIEGQGPRPLADGQQFVCSFVRFLVERLGIKHPKTNGAQEI